MTPVSYTPLDAISAEERSKRIIEQAQNGMIILLHDREGNFRTVQALDTIIPELKRQGYTFEMCIRDSLNICRQGESAWIIKTTEKNCMNIIMY